MSNHKLEHNSTKLPTKTHTNAKHKIVKVYNEKRKTPQDTQYKHKTREQKAQNTKTQRTTFRQRTTTRKTVLNMYEQ